MQSDVLLIWYIGKDHLTDNTGTCVPKIVFYDMDKWPHATEYTTRALIQYQNVILPV